MLRFIAIVDRLIDWLGALAAGMLITLVLLMTYNVLARYAFNSSSIGLEELSWHFYSCTFLFGIPYALKHNAHVRVDLLFEKFSAKNKLIVDLLGTALFLIPFCIVVIWAGWQFTAAAYQLGVQPSSASEFFSQLVSGGIGEKSQDPGGLLNRWIIKAVIPLTFVFLLLAAVSQLLQKALALRSLNDAEDNNNEEGLT
jgi:TRAP-type mannitol/chloroaromatic compound transport system permease small subunit